MKITAFRVWEITQLAWKSRKNSDLVKITFRKEIFLIETVITPICVLFDIFFFFLVETLIRAVHTSYGDTDRLIDFLFGKCFKCPCTQRMLKCNRETK